jgi:hypothetical protein
MKDLEERTVHKKQRYAQIIKHAKIVEASAMANVLGVRDPTLEETAFQVHSVFLRLPYAEMEVFLIIHIKLHVQEVTLIIIAQNEVNVNQLTGFIIVIVHEDVDLIVYRVKDLVMERKAAWPPERLLELF